MSAALLALLGRPAAADEAKVENKPAVDPLVVEVFNLEVTGPPLGLSFYMGGHQWIDNRVFVGLRGVVRTMAITRDLDGDGTTDFSREAGTNPRHIELQADMAVALRRRVDRASHGSGTIQVTRDAAGKETRTWAKTTTFERVRDVSLAFGARAALGQEFQLGIPVGIRAGTRYRTKDFMFREHWVQARLILIPQKPTAGVDMEVVYMPAYYGLSLHFEYFPKIGDTDPAGPTCRLAPPACDPATPLSSFNRIPDQGMWQLALRFRAAFVLAPLFP